jgi:hypothetical protein
MVEGMGLKIIAWMSLTMPSPAYQIYENIPIDSKVIRGT